MKRLQFKKLFKGYIDDGINIIDIELTNDRVIGFNVYRHRYILDSSHVWVGGEGLSVTIDYRVITGVAI